MNYQEPLKLINLALSLTLLFIAGLLVFLKISNGTELDHVSGAWTVLASDLANGIFYRPLFSESIGTGGTRFFPLFFSLHAVIIKMFGNATVAGHFVSLLSGTLVITILYRMLRHLGQKKIITITLLSFLILTKTMLHGFTAIRGDLLPLFFNILGLYLIYSDKFDKSKSLVFGSICFVLAFSAKITAINGVTAVFLWKLVNRENKDAFRVALYTGLGMIFSFFLFQLLSEGRMIEIFKVCSSGGTNIVSLVKAPIKFIKYLTSSDLISSILLIWVFIQSGRFKISNKNSLFYLFFIMSLAQILILFASPGINYNHFVDIATASLLIISLNIDKDKFVYPMILISLFIILFSMDNFSFELENFKNSNKKYSHELISYVAQHESVLCEDPFVAIKSSEKAYLLDAFMYKFIIRKYPEAKTELLSKIKEREFNLIVLMKDPKNEMKWYEDTHFNKEFLELLFENYKLEKNISGQIIYKPL